VALWKKAGNVEITPWKKSVRKLWGSREKDRDLARRLARGAPAHPDSADSEAAREIAVFLALACHHGQRDKENSRSSPVDGVLKIAWTGGAYTVETEA
jgi:hypothetical protein